MLFDNTIVVWRDNICSSFSPFVNCVLVVGHRRGGRLASAGCSGGEVDSAKLGIAHRQGCMCGDVYVSQREDWDSTPE
jgi:hypothetical protein